MLPKASKTCPKSNKSPNLVTLVLRNGGLHNTCRWVCGFDTKMHQNVKFYFVSSTNDLTIDRRNKQERDHQCYQMVKLCFNIGPFATTKISPIMSQFCQSRFAILTNFKNKLSKFCQILVNFCQSGEISPNLVTGDHHLQQFTFLSHSLVWNIFLYSSSISRAVEVDRGYGYGR